MASPKLLAKRHSRPFKLGLKTREYRAVLRQALDYAFAAWRVSMIRPERFEVGMFLANAAFQRQRLREMVNPARRIPRLTMTKAEEEQAFGFLRVKR